MIQLLFPVVFHGALSYIASVALAGNDMKTLLLRIPQKLFTLHSATLVFLFTMISGCVSSGIVQPDYLELDVTKDIVVSTYDGRDIRMFRGDYEIVRVGEKNRLRGKGALYLNQNRTETKPFVGEISLDEIKHVEVREKSTLYYTGPILFGVAAGVIILMAIVFGAPGG